MVAIDAIVAVIVSGFLALVTAVLFYFAFWMDQGAAGADESRDLPTRESGDAPESSSAG